VRLTDTTTAGWWAAPDAGNATELLRRGKTIPYSWYVDPGLFELELDAIFGKTWQYVGHSSRLAETGDFITCMVGRIPVMVTRDAKGALHGYVNVCPHRGHPVAMGAGRRTTIQCMYHGWTFGLDGVLRSAPRSDREPDFSGDGICLRPVLVDRWGPLIFVNPDLDAAPFADTLGGIPDLAHERGFDFDGLPYRAHRDFEIACNWKLAMDNNTECYHCATIHPGFRSDYHVDRDNYEVLRFEQSFSHFSPPRAERDTWSDFHLYYIWPNFMLSARGNDHYYTYSYVPTGPEQTLQMTEYFVPATVSEAELESQIEDLRLLMAEDWGVFERVQVGMRSGMLPFGNLLAQEERLLRQFQQLYVDAIAGHVEAPA
jgi:phenylpropionate dioxygenase-like ring-hydroxylating dioxygenase large terminal subunit